MLNILAVDHDKLFYGSLMKVNMWLELSYIWRYEKENIMGQKKKPTIKGFIPSSPRSNP